MLARSLLVAALPLTAVLFALAGCDAPAVPSGTDGGPGVGSDAGPGGGDGGATDARRPGRDAPGGCTIDADCDDGDPSTHEYCQPFLRTCVASECITDDHCDDGDPCTLDYCLSMSNCGHGSNNCCFGEADCFDGNDCTSDACGLDQLCHWDPVPAPGCVACPDNDGDGDGATWCGGLDCDDFDPMRAPSRAEDCMNSIDDDCDGAVDIIDTACSPANLMCPGTPIVLGTATHGTTITPGGSSGPAMGCGASAFYTLTLAVTSDVDVTLRLDTPPPPVAPCPGCPPPSGPMQLNYRAYLEPVCSERTGDLFGGASAFCNYWDPSGGGFFSGAQESTYSHRRVPAGTYTLEVQAGPMFAWMAGSTGFTVTARATPSVDAICDGATLTAGATARGTTTGGLDAFGSACDGAVRAAPERIHPFTLLERSRVRLEVSPDEVAPGSVPAARVAILSACDAASATRLACLESSGSGCQPISTIERILEAGSYEALVEARDGGAIAYGLRLDVEAVGAACAGAPVIDVSGMTSGTTALAPDEFRDDRVCGGGRGPDAIYRLDVAVRSRVVLDVIASYARPLLRVYTGCGEARVAASSSTPRVDVMLDPGRYDVVVGSERAEDSGSFVLSTTMLPI